MPARWRRPRLAERFSVVAKETGEHFQNIEVSAKIDASEAVTLAERTR
jgi:hypothetical protein